MEHRWRRRMAFRVLMIAWAAGSSVAAGRPLEAGVIDEQNFRSDCQPQQVLVCWRDGWL